MCAQTLQAAVSDVGQLWGNPLYGWPALRRRRYRWWVERIRRTLSLFDMAWIDHCTGSCPPTATIGTARAASAGGSTPR
jgi:4-alpha-glucanotransferase